jgi:hypothetical protein
LRTASLTSHPDQPGVTLERVPDLELVADTKLVCEIRGDLAVVDPLQGHSDGGFSGAEAIE